MFTSSPRVDAFDSLQTGKRSSFTAASALVLALVFSSPLLAGNTAQILRGVENSWPTVELAVRLAGSENSKLVSIGEPLRYELSGDRRGVCYLVHLDSRGNASLMRPGDCATLTAGQNSYFPSSGSLKAAEPLGREYVFAFMTTVELPVAESILGTSKSYAPLDSSQTLNLLVADLKRAALGGGVAVAETSYQVSAASSQAATTEASAEPELQYTMRGIIRKVQAAEVEPSIEAVTEEVSFDVQSINFEFGSDQLTQDGMRQLDEFGAAMASPELESVKLKVAGHTDDQGDPAYNLDLSQRRATSVGVYLEQKFNISRDRLDIVGFGEDSPIIADTSMQARAQNRRVEMVFIRE